MTAPPLTVPSPAAPRAGAADDVAIRLRGLTLGYGPASAPPIVEDLDLDVPAGRVTAIIGANGCGKSTLLRGLTRQLAPRAGSIEVLGRDAARVSARDYARTVALLPQHPVAPEGMTVAQLVARGRHPHRGLLGGRAAGDDAAIASALERTDLVELAEREAGTLSGGQRQRAWLALVLAQQTPVVLLDEPTSYLDLSHQVEVLDLVRALKLPVLLVVGMRLGCVNHARLTAQSLQSSGVECLGWIGNHIDPAMQRQDENFATLRQRLPMPCWGRLPHLPGEDGQILSTHLLD